MVAEVLRRIPGCRMMFPDAQPPNAGFAEEHDYGARQTTAQHGDVAETILDFKLPGAAETFVR